MAASGIYESGKVICQFVAPLAIRSNQPTFSMDTLSLKRQSSTQGVQRWEITANLEPSNNSANFFLHSVINGYDNVFTILMPQIYRRGGTEVTTATGVYKTIGSATKGASYVSVTGGGKIARGEFIKFSNHDKVYVITSDVNGDGDMFFYPALRANLVPDIVISYKDNVLMPVTYDNTTVLGITYVDGVLSDPGSVTLIEHL